MVLRKRYTATNHCREWRSEKRKFFGKKLIASLSAMVLQGGILKKHIQKTKVTKI